MINMYNKIIKEGYIKDYLLHAMLIQPLIQIFQEV